MTEQTLPEDKLPAFDIDRKQLSTVRKRFTKLNRQKLDRLQKSLTNYQRDLPDIITLAIHENHPSLPGYVNKDVPSGISDYTPLKSTLDAARRMAKSFKSRKRAHMRREILSVFVMGSSGTIGHSGESDLDVWVCHRSELDKEQLELLQQKLSALTQWARSIGMSLHFFLMDENYFKSVSPAPMDKESAGSSQHYLLLDEFYRTAILLAGRMPLWWMIPPEANDHYQSFADHLLTKRYLKTSDWIDFGQVPELPADEFFGAGLWHVYKGIDSPYKSVLKIMLMEVYASQYPGTTPLCEDYKQMVYEDDTDPDRVDAYIMVYRKVEAYLISQNQYDRLELLRRCFYLKVAPKLSHSMGQEPTHWQKTLMLSLIQQWGWEQDTLLQLDSRHEWKINRVVKERKKLVGELTHSYHFLSGFARSNSALNLIRQEDVTLLGRKLYAAFERRSGKVEYINPGIAPNLNENDLTFQYTTTHGGMVNWQLYKQAVSEKDASYHISIKRSTNIIELICWAIFNGLMTMETQIHLNAGDSGLTLNELKSISRRLMQDFPFELHHPDDEAFREGARLRFACLLVNVGVDPLAEFSRRGLQLVSDQNDPIAYGNQQLNLALTFDLITLNSWGEISLSRYSKDNALISCLSDWLSMLPTDASHNPQINVLCYSKNKAESIVRRINQLLSELTNAFYEHQQEGALRYILKVSEQYQLLEVQEQAIEVQAFDNESTLTTALSWPRFQYSPLKVDSLALSKSPLASIYQTNRPNKIQLFFLPYQDQADVWILDEASTLFHKQEPFHTKQHLLNPYRRFLQSVIYRQSIIGNTALDPTIEIHQLSDPKEPGSDWPIKQLQMSDDVGMSPYLTIQAIISADYAENPMLTFYFADEEFSTLEHGDKLFEVLAECIMERRQGDLTYPAYVTDLDISTLELKERQVTSQYLSIKSDLEKQITYALEKLSV